MDGKERLCRPGSPADSAYYFPEELSMKSLNRTTKIISKSLEILFLAASVIMLGTVIASFAVPQRLGKFLLESVGNGMIATNGFEIAIADGSGNLLPGAVRIFAFAGLLTMLCMTMVFRNIYLIFQTAEGRTWFSSGKTPFQKDIVRMVREIGMFSIFIPVIGLIMSAVAKLIYGVDNIETSVQVTGIAMGIAMICLSQFFAYGQSLEQDVEGLV